jgi:hypothetical protein
VRRVQARQKQHSSATPLASEAGFCASPGSLGQAGVHGGPDVVDGGLGAVHPALDVLDDAAGLELAGRVVVVVSALRAAATSSASVWACGPPDSGRPGRPAAARPATAPSARPRGRSWRPGSSRKGRRGGSGSRDWSCARVHGWVSGSPSSSVSIEIAYPLASARRLPVAVDPARLLIPSQKRHVGYWWTRGSGRWRSPAWRPVRALPHRVDFSGRGAPHPSPLSACPGSPCPRGGGRRRRRRRGETRVACSKRTAEAVACLSDAGDSRGVLGEQLAAGAGESTGRPVDRAHPPGVLDAADVLAGDADRQVIDAVVVEVGLQARGRGGLSRRRAVCKRLGRRPDTAYQDEDAAPARRWATLSGPGNSKDRQPREGA